MYVLKYGIQIITFVTFTFIININIMYISTIKLAFKREIYRR